MYYQPPRALGLIVGGLLTLWSAALTFLLLDAGTSGGSSALALFAVLESCDWQHPALFGIWSEAFELIA